LSRDIPGLIDDSLDDSGRDAASEFARDVEACGGPGALATVEVAGALGVMSQWFRSGLQCVARRLRLTAGDKRARLGYRPEVDQRRLNA
jgi:hypothetical protein